MANYQTIINKINEEITTNGQMRITGAVLNGVLTAMVASLGTGCRFGGIVTPTSTVTEPDGNVFYFATQGGTYTACGGVVIQDGVSVIKYDGGTWGAMQLLWYDTEPRQDSTRLVLSGGIYDALQAQEERFRGVEQDMADLIAKIFDDEEVYQVTKVYSASVTDTNSRQTARKNRTYLNEISAKDGAVITSLKVEMGGSDITKDVYTGPHSAEIIGHASGNEASDLQNGDSYSSGEITPDAGWGIKSVRVEMGDDDITSEALSGHEVSVDDVMGDIAVEVETACEVVDEPFLSRITANGLTLANDRALIRSLHGNTLAWNQIVTDSTTELTISGTTTLSSRSLGLAIPLNHQIYISAYVKKTTDFAAGESEYYQSLVLKQGGNTHGGRLPYLTIAKDNAYHRVSGIVTNANATNNSIGLYAGSHTAGDVSWKDVLVIDLTQMFGAGNEPTIAEFEALYPLGSYATDAGRLLDFKGETLVSKDTEENVLSTITINPTAMYGYLNGEGEAVRPFENGMRSAGSVFDTVKKVDGKWYALVSVGSVNLGTLSWSLRTYNGNTCFQKTLVGRKNLAYGICTKYSVIGHLTNVNPVTMRDKSIVMNTYFANDAIYVKDTSFNDDAATFKDAMDGVMLNYELATPRTYLLTDEWQQILNTAYQVETGGMEIVLPENGSEPTTSPAKMEIQYGTDGTENN